MPFGSAPATTSHAADSTWIGFYYQAFFALLLLLQQESDNAAVAVEQLDDVALKVDGFTLLHQLKHSTAATPPPLTLKAVAYWKTIKAWIDVLDAITLSETTLHLVTVAPLGSGSPLEALLTRGSERVDLLTAMVDEALRVRADRAKAAAEGKPLPHVDRSPGCQAFLALSDATRLNLLRSVVLEPSNLSLVEIESAVADSLKLLPRQDRSPVASRLMQWWDREIVYSLCGQRDRLISRVELQHKISVLVSEIEQDVLMPDFELFTPPADYQPASMLARQIMLVGGKESDLKRAIREEWKAREQRGKWTDGNPAMATTIGDYDLLLQQEWSDRHMQMTEDTDGLDEAARATAGLSVLRWTHEQAPNTTRPIAAGWNAAYYVRGSYQVLAIDLRLGWHPDYLARLQAKT